MPLETASCAPTAASRPGTSGRSTARSAGCASSAADHPTPDADLRVSLHRLRPSRGHPPRDQRSGATVLPVVRSRGHPAQAVRGANEPFQGLGWAEGRGSASATRAAASGSKSGDSGTTVGRRLPDGGSRSVSRAGRSRMHRAPELTDPLPVLELVGSGAPRVQSIVGPRLSKSSGSSGSSESRSSAAEG
jgi:hypothetical protein